MATNRDGLGGVIHTYQKYDPLSFPSPSAPPPDLASAAMEHLLHYGNTRRLTEEELANAVRLDPSQIAGLGPSIEAPKAILEERKRKLLETYETRRVAKDARRAFQQAASQLQPPSKLKARVEKALRDEQLRELENLWFQADEASPFARGLLHAAERLGEKYQVDELAGKYDFTGAERLDIPKALEVREELAKIDELLRQLEEAAKTAQIGVVDMEMLAEFAEPGDIEQLGELHQRIADYLKTVAEAQGLEQSQQGFKLTPQAHRLFQGKLLTAIFGELQAARSGRHTGPIMGEGAVETARTKEYEFGDSLANLDIPGSLVNSMLRNPGQPPRFEPRDLIVHRTQNHPRAATVAILDMSGSMEYGGQYVDVKRMALGLEGLVRTEYPGDYVGFVEMYSVGKVRQAAEIPGLMPKPKTIRNPVVRLKADLSDPEVSEAMLPPHFTNIQHSLQLARRLLAARDTPNKRIVLITDGLPTAHFEGETLYLLYPPDPRTEQATMREALLCAQEGIVLNIFLLQSWSQTDEDIRFARRLAESTKGRVAYCASRDLDRFVLWDYAARTKRILA
jgi:uncharacterized protein with von Willebrand factor type A (vWA) domain